LGGKVVSGREYDRVVAINDRLSTANEVLRDRLIGDADSRVANTDALKETASVLRDATYLLRDLGPPKRRGT
jgi:hypothetical protein